MLSFETAKWRFASMNGRAFPLVFWSGTGRIVEVGKGSMSLQVRGKRAEYTWARLQNVWDRVRQNHAVGVDELGGGHDAVGAVSVLALLEDEDVELDREHGVLRLRDPKNQPVHEYVPMVGDGVWDTLERKTSGN
jgi:hypothetical protein